MEKKIHSVSVVEQCVVTPASPPHNDIHAQLTFLDIPWMYTSNIQRLVFYKIPNLSRSQFVGNILPRIKNSLSLTLDHFPLVAGNLIIPPNTNSYMPEISFRNGDGVTLIFAECHDIDFNHLVMNDERDCDEFYPLVPEIKASSLKAVSTTSPVLALQVTLFPGVGLSVGITNHHAMGDGKSMFMFMKTWSTFNFKLSHSKDDDDEYPVSESQLVFELPVFDNNLIQDNRGLTKITCDQWMNLVSSSNIASSESTQINTKVRKTFLISAENVKKLKNLLSNTVRVSSFVVVCSYIWTCLVKSRQDEDEQTQHILFPADCRERTDPLIPANYFGNCLAPIYTGLSGKELVGEFGFQRACELLGRTIKEKFRQKDSVFDGDENYLEAILNLNWPCCQTLAGSTRHNFYTLDFGWGSAVKFEFISIDSNSAISMSCCRDSDGGVEVGLAFTVPQMKAFSSFFTEGLNC